MHNKKAVYSYLKHEIFPQLAPPPYGEIRMTRLANGKPVYLFHETKRGLTVVGKSFEDGRVAAGKAWEKAEREYRNLKTLSGSFGANGRDCRIVTPLGVNRELASLLVITKAPGNPLDHYIARAIYEGRRQKLFDKLTLLAAFLAELHHHADGALPVAVDLPERYMDKLLRSLNHGLLSGQQADGIRWLALGWWRRGELTADRAVTVHGDATPMNFFFYRNRITAIDFEKMKRADRCWDLGFVAAELKHHFMWRAGNGWDAEPFIGHFLWEYAKHSQGLPFFLSVTRRLPLYMALGLMRIARNPWLSDNYRRNLINEARLCLMYSP